MSAIVTKMVIRCAQLFCNRAARYEVIHPYDAVREGPYCRKCADRVASELDREWEKKDGSTPSN